MMKTKFLFTVFYLAILSGSLFAENSEDIVRIKITCNGHTLLGYLNDSVTADYLTENLPLTLPMHNLFSREMVYRFPDSLPTDDVKHTGYKVGEIIYWPPGHSFVIMYAQNGERFSMQKVGFIESDLSFFKGMGTADVTIESMEEE